MEALPPSNAIIADTPTPYEINRALDGELFSWDIPKLATNVKVTTFCRGAANNPNLDGAESIRITATNTDPKFRDKVKLLVLIDSLVTVNGQALSQTETMISTFKDLNAATAQIFIDLLPGNTYTVQLLADKELITIAAKRSSPCPTRDPELDKILLDYLNTYTEPEE